MERGAMIASPATVQIKAAAAVGDVLTAPASCVALVITYLGDNIHFAWSKTSAADALSKLGATATRARLDTAGAPCEPLPMKEGEFFAFQAADGSTATTEGVSYYFLAGMEQN